MQPYFLPYIGYFALINAVDKFVYYDDVQYIRRGWINRNRVKMKDDWLYITIPVKKAPLSTNINQIFIVNKKKEIKKIKKTIKHCYIKAPYYEKIKKLIFQHIKPGMNISNLNINLTNEIAKYLNIKTRFYISSNIDKNNSLSGEKMILEICKKLNSNIYINPIGGVKLYSKKRFEKYNIKLKFLEMKRISYPQGDYDFIENLSILDVLVYNSREEVKKMLEDYTLKEFV